MLVLWLLKACVNFPMLPVPTTRLITHQYPALWLAKIHCDLGPMFVMRRLDVVHRGETRLVA